MSDIKTMQGWNDSKIGSFDNYVKPGDQVDEEIFDYFLNVLPPLNWRQNYLQVNEPYSHEFNPKTNRWQGTYSTFVKIENVWTYAGNCFDGETKNIE